MGCRAPGAGGWKGGGALVVKVLQHLLHELVGEALRDALGDVVLVRASHREVGLHPLLLGRLGRRATRLGRTTPGLGGGEGGGERIGALHDGDGSGRLGLRVLLAEAKHLPEAHTTAGDGDGWARGIG